MSQLLELIRKAQGKKDWTSWRTGRSRGAGRVEGGTLIFDGGLDGRAQVLLRRKRRGGGGETDDWVEEERRICNFKRP